MFEVYMLRHPDVLKKVLLHLAIIIVIIIIIRIIHIIIIINDAQIIVTMSWTTLMGALYRVPK